MSIDARPEALRNANRGLFDELRSGGIAKMATVYVTLGETVEDPVLERFGLAQAGAADVATVVTPRGYTAELAIPFADLDAAAEGPWDGLRVNVTVSDFDEGETAHTTLLWRPSRYDGRAAEGSGTFVRD